MKTKRLGRLLSSASGFSMVELAMAMGLVGLISFGVMKLSDNTQNVAKNIKNKDGITQLQHEIRDILINANNCEATLNGKTINSDVSAIYRVTHGEPKAWHEANPLASAKVSIQSMKIKSIDDNGSNGSNALATLEITYRKPSKIVPDLKTKTIKVVVNLCEKKIIENADLQILMGSCTGAAKRLIDGPNKWNGNQWAVCQDCTNASSKIIRSCQSQGEKGRVSSRSVEKLACLNTGGTFDDDTSICDQSDFIAKAIKKACLAAGATPDESVSPPVCKLTNLPTCIINPNTCSVGLYPVEVARYSIKENTTTTQRSCFQMNMFGPDTCGCQGDGCTCSPGSGALGPITCTDQGVVQIDVVHRKCCKQ